RLRPFRREPLTHLATAPEDLAGRIAALIDADPARANLSGAIRISRDGVVLFERAYGQASVQLGVANALSTRFAIASVTKAFIAAVVLRLADEGLLALDQHPGAYLAELARLDRRITLHHLLTHTAGVADVYGVPDLRLKMAKLKAEGGRLLDYLAALPPPHAPGQRWSYSSTGFLLLAYLAEAAGGQPFAQLLNERLLDPLGLADTGPDDPVLVNPGRASGHAMSAGAWRNASNDALAEIEGPRELYSTVGDLDRWCGAILSGEALSQAAAALSFSPHAHVGPGSDFDPTLAYGYGWFLGPDYRFVGGVTAGFRAAVWQHPAERLNVLMLWNNEPINSHRLWRSLTPVVLG
ncbi:MAG TPA: serine hydrolase domain-containing protein, partial [Caulobacteraceae bacterium]|nr:serine hydrolase domain-containing protein [Caulobacteraceae bacterium]